jgi:hypothetical protein
MLLHEAVVAFVAVEDDMVMVVVIVLVAALEDVVKLGLLQDPNPCANFAKRLVIRYFSVGNDLIVTSLVKRKARTMRSTTAIASTWPSILILGPQIMSPTS